MQIRWDGECFLLLLLPYYYFVIIPLLVYIHPWIHLNSLLTGAQHGFSMVCAFFLAWQAAVLALLIIEDESSVVA